MKVNDIKEMFERINLFFPNSGLSADNSIQVLEWAKLMTNMDKNKVKSAIDKIIRKEKFNPTFATINEYYLNEDVDDEYVDPF